MTGAYSDTSFKGWDAYLFEGEKVVWQGRPHWQMIFANRSKAEKITGAVMMGLSVFGILAIRMMHSDGAIVPVLVFLLGAGIALGIHPKDILLRAVSTYSLTNRRALIASNLFGQRKLNGYYINPNVTLEFIDGARPTLYFAIEEKTVKRRDTEAERQRSEGGSSSDSGPIYRDVVIRQRIGFEYIDEGRKVFELMQAMRKGGV